MAEMNIKSLLLSRPVLIVMALGMAVFILFLADLTFDHLMDSATVGTAVEPIERYIKIKLSNRETVEFIKWHDKEELKDGAYTVRVKYRIYVKPDANNSTSDTGSTDSPSSTDGGTDEGPKADPKTDPSNEPALAVSFHHDKVFHIDGEGMVTKVTRPKKSP